MECSENLPARGAVAIHRTRNVFAVRSIPPACGFESLRSGVVHYELPLPGPHIVTKNINGLVIGPDLEVILFVGQPSIDDGGNSDPAASRHECARLSACRSGYRLDVNIHVSQTIDSNFLVRTTSKNQAEDCLLIPTKFTGKMRVLSVDKNTSKSIDGFA